MKWSDALLDLDAGKNSSTRPRITSTA